MDLDVEHRILLPEGVIRYVHVVAHAGKDSSGGASGLSCTEIIAIVTTSTPSCDPQRQQMEISWLRTAERPYILSPLPSRHSELKFLFSHQDKIPPHPQETAI
jgi:hypothetical protein